MERSPFPDPSPDTSLTAIDPFLIYTPIHSHPSTISSDASTSSPAPDVTRSEHTSPTPQPDRLPSAASTRADSPSAEPVESGHSPRLHYPRHPYPQHAQRPTPLQRPSSSLRHRPYNQKGRRAGPTSAPSSAVSLTDEQLVIQDDAEKYSFTTYQDQTTLVMGVLVHLDALARQCEEMRTFIRTGFGDGNEDSNRARSRIERTRLELRNWNRTHVTELDEILQPLPRSDDGEIPRDAPSTGRMVQWLDHAEMMRLLDAYDLPFIPTMFLYEKKAIYLRFVGTSRALMHRVLDEQLSVPTG